MEATTLRALCLGLALATVPSAHSKPTALSPADTVSEFYAWKIHGKSGRLDAIAAVRELLAPTLFEALQAADAYERACARMVPRGIKPYQLEGDVWYHHADDGARALAGATGHVRGEAAWVAAALSYDEDIRWTDRVILRRIDGRWRIVDIHFEQGGSVVSRLQRFAAYRCS